MKFHNSFSVQGKKQGDFTQLATMLTLDIQQQYLDVLLDKNNSPHFTLLKTSPLERRVSVLVGWNNVPCMCLLLCFLVFLLSRATYLAVTKPIRNRRSFLLLKEQT